jgi:hypothetical protein
MTGIPLTHEPWHQYISLLSCDRTRLQSVIASRLCAPVGAHPSEGNQEAVFAVVNMERDLSNVLVRVEAPQDSVLAFATRVTSYARKLVTA